MLLVAQVVPHRPNIKQVILDGVAYEISLTPFSGGLHRATWICSECDEPGAWAPISCDAREAIRMANAGLEVHHALVHQSRPKYWRPK